MAWGKIRSGVIALVTFCIIMIVSIAVIAYGRGYRPDFRQSTIRPTGLLSLSSDPVGAQVYINGTLRTATNNSLSIEPGWYTLKIAKEGYLSWEKKVRLQGEIVVSVDPFLFPSNPSLSPVTTVGIETPVVSPDGTKVVYTIPAVAQAVDGVPAKKAGLWVYELVERPLGRNRDPIQIGITDPTFDFSKAAIIWSPDSTQIMADNGISIRLYRTDRTNDFQDISYTYQMTLREWDADRQAKEKVKLAVFKQPIIDIATSSARIIALSPDETKILYEATASATIPQIVDPPIIGSNATEEERTIQAGKIYVYDSKEDKNYFVLGKNEIPQPKPSPTPKGKTIPDRIKLSSNTTSTVSNLYWFPTSRHLLLTLEGKIDIMEYDRTNWITVYSGPFVDGFIAPWPNGSRIIIMTNLNPDVTTLSNLYTVNLR